VAAIVAGHGRQRGALSFIYFEHEPGRRQISGNAHYCKNATATAFRRFRCSRRAHMTGRLKTVARRTLATPNLPPGRTANATGAFAYFLPFLVQRRHLETRGSLAILTAIRRASSRVSRFIGRPSRRDGGWCAVTSPAVRRRHGGRSANRPCGRQAAGWVSRLADDQHSSWRRSCNGLIRSR
jgi:hypothetical protein